ncbi:hypothetical protein OZN62_09215 [Aurantiacibacter sp. MUD11]|uniref:hypothetical protein n=1 Tax=Aurantiacibacter sp. MUD11 TaxID=3003265 RepID=UPI0022AA0D45|nr:hypothetical protein [Aurantiacibacter sp. MUD11]WAT17115.1 hypothetical protein OZN62_09215 [Aurantiacibacter sp. MUD11]
MLIVLAGCDTELPNRSNGSEFVSEALRASPLRACKITGVGSNEQQREVVEHFPFCTLESGTAEWVCRDGSREAIDRITPMGLRFRIGCSADLGYGNRGTIQYNGEIDLSFLQLIETIESLNADQEATHQMMCEDGSTSWCNPDPFEGALIIDSPGGDPKAAIDAARLMARSKWTVVVEPESQCASACVLLIAGAAERLLYGEIGIHRVFPVGSSADTREELEGLLTEITADARALMTENGVSPRLVEDMMTIPSSQIRILTRTELEAYGLGRENSAQLDLERASLERQCGEDFAQRLIEAEALSEQCGGSEVGGDMLEYRMCLNAGYAQLGFPDARCPEDGPRYACPDPTARYGIRYTYERCE